MTSDLTSRTMVVISRVGDFWITPEQASRLTAAQDGGDAQYAEIEGNLVSFKSIDGIVTAQAYEDLNARRRGSWSCKFGHWHERNEQCAHHMIQR